MSDDAFALIPAGARAIAPDWWREWAGNALYVSSIDPAKGMDARIELLETLTGDSDKASDWVNKTLAVRHVTIVPVTGVDDDGEVKTYPRVVLGLADGQRIGFGSEGVFRSVALIIALMGKPPWEPALSVVLTQKELPNARRYYYLRMVRPEGDERGSRRRSS